MKSRSCAQCNVSSVRFSWGFALLVRDGWAVTAADSADPPDDEWLCPSCKARASTDRPRLAKTASVEPPASRRSRPRNCLRLLLVDDEDMVRRSTARSLADFEVVTASSGAEALAILSEDLDFDAVLSDVMMPRMTGPQLFEQCYERYPLLAQRFVLASGNPGTARDLLLAAVERVGADQAPILLAKPCSREALMLALFAASAHTALGSGTWSVVEPAAGVTNYRG